MQLSSRLMLATLLAGLGRRARLRARYGGTSLKGTKMKRTSITILVLGALAMEASYAQSVERTQLAQTGAGSTAPTMAEAEVRKVDKDAAKITLRHGEIKNLDMPAMTMVFQVKDKAMLDKVKVGDKVRFVADKVGGAFTIIQIEPAN